MNLKIRVRQIARRSVLMDIHMIRKSHYAYKVSIYILLIYVNLFHLEKIYGDNCIVENCSICDAQTETNKD